MGTAMDTGAYREDRQGAAAQEPWLAFRHAAVRDLVWTLASPPLLRPAGKSPRWINTAWGERALRASADWLKALDRHPAPLLDALAKRSDHRLGSHFEGLLAFWLAWPGNPLYRLVGHNLAVRSNNRTLGELDFLVEDRQSGELQHWEVAVKFYLGVAPGGEHRHWIGPGLKDRLDLKVDRLIDHQLALSRTAEGAGLIRHLGLTPPTPVCFFKGRLFYPPDVPQADWAPQAAAADHLTGWWLPQQAFLDRHGDSGLYWIRLPKEHWLTPVAADVPIGDAGDAAAFIETLRASADNRAAAVIGLARDNNNYREVTRGFITPPDWPELLEH